MCYFTGSFGNGVLSYFTFLKWLLWLNIYVFILTLCFVIIPQALSSGEELPLTITAQNASAFTSNSSSSSTVVPANVTASSLARKKREVLLNKSEEEDNDLKCNLVKPYNYSSYTNKPFPQLLSDFISGIVSIGRTPYLKQRGRRNGLAVCALDSGSKPGFGQNINTYFHSDPLHPRVQMGAGELLGKPDEMQGGNLAMD